MTPRRHMLQAITLFFAASLLTACASRPAVESGSSGAVMPLTELTDWMTGSFSSHDQAMADPDNFRDVRLHMARIWLERSDGPWLYVEQAMANTLDQPYRQRVYQLSAEPGGTFRSRVYRFRDESPESLRALAGAWREPAPLANLSPADLTALEGCDIVMTRAGDASFMGATAGTGCSSTRAGASYTTAQVTITPESLTSWDRGFAASGKQVWGATAGGYRFIKIDGPGVR